MRFIIMFVAAVCFMFLIKLKWPKYKDNRILVPRATWTSYSPKAEHEGPAGLDGIGNKNDQFNVIAPLRARQS